MRFKTHGSKDPVRFGDSERERFVGFLNSSGEIQDPRFQRSGGIRRFGEGEFVGFLNNSGEIRGFLR